MSAISVSAQGFQWAEHASSVVDRPVGLGCFVLLHFRSPMEVRLEQERFPVAPGHCLLFSPGHPHWYRGLSGAWVNDWMHIEGEATAQFATRYGVTMNTVLSPGSLHFLPRFFEEVARERQHLESGWEEAVELLVQQFFLHLGRSLRDSLAHLTPAEAEHLRAMRALRWRVQGELTRRWTVSEMAAEIGLSSSRFAALYRHFFEVSPMEDLLRARLRHAQNLLTNRTLSVREAATLSGFASMHYFSHVFHSRVGCAPRDYHRHVLLSSHHNQSCSEGMDEAQA